MFAPAGTPKAIIDRLNGEIGKALSDPDVATKLSAQTLDATRTSPDELAQRMRAEYETIGTLYRQLNLKLD